MVELRIGSETIKLFIGKENTVTLLKKVKLIVKLQKIQDLLTFLVLYLERDG